MRAEFFNKEPDNLGLHLVNCGYEDCPAGFICNPHRRDYYLVHYVVKGEGFYRVGENQFPVREGQAFIIYPGQIVSYSTGGGFPWSFCWFGISGRDAAACLAEASVRKPIYVVKCSAGIRDQILSCLEYTENSPLSQLRLNAYVFRFLLCLGEGEKPSSPHYAERGIRFIEYNYMNRISTKDVAEYLNIDRTYFYRVFKEYTGKSPEKYLMEFRIRKAAELMEDSRYSIGQISDFVGICDPYYFSKLFKKIMGISPSVYRRRPGA